jgi:hypothetical protein
MHVGSLIGVTVALGMGFLCRKRAGRKSRGLTANRLCL